MVYLFLLKLNNSKTPTPSAHLGHCSCFSAVYAKCLPERLFGLPILCTATLLQLPGKQLSEYSTPPHPAKLTFGRRLH